MTRDAEHTPTGYEDAASVVVNQAPATSSLAGGEVEGESVALMRPFWVSWWGDPGTFELHRPWWVSGERDDGKQSICAAVLAQDEFTARLSVQWAHYDKDVVLEWRFVEEKPKGWSPFGDRFRQADWMRWPENAALSPEAPAREGVVMAAADVPMWADGIATDGENVAMAQKAETDHGGHYWAVDGGNGGLDWEPTHFISLDALTPRHEAPAEGAGEALDAAEQGRLAAVINMLEPVAENNETVRLYGKEVAVLLKAIRARSSAPEAREGEAVAWDHAVRYLDNPWKLASDFPPDFFEEIQSDPKWKVQPLYTHPAAPSADKLRAVVEGFVSDLTGSLKNRSTMLTINHNALTARIDQALAALKAEG